MIPRSDQRAFDSFVAGSSDRLMRTAYLLCGDRGHAEDMVQTALLRAARRWSTVGVDPATGDNAGYVELASGKTLSVSSADVTRDELTAMFASPPIAVPFVGASAG